MMNSTPEHQTILIVDDEADLLKGLSRSLGRRLEDVRFVTANGGPAALEIIEKRPPAVVLLDIKMAGMSGMEVLDKIMLIDADITVVMMTAFASIELAVEAMRRGAWDFVTKPLDLDSLARLLSRGVERARLQRDNKLLLSRLEAGEKQASFVGSSPTIQQLQRSIRMVAKTDYTVLIRGDSGTGKEIAATMIHTLSPRRDKPFVIVNCPAIPENLLESELFGHCRGAFTGANSDHQGQFVQADGGTICLDEIGDIPVAIQTKLLRVLQSKEIKILGSDKARPVDVRILASTNRNLEEKIAENSFREDLFYRLNVVAIHTPSLEEIAEDIALIADHFLRQACAELGCTPKALSLEAADLLTRQRWPGNARQLQNTIRRAAMFCPDEVIGTEHLGTLGQTEERKQTEPTTRIEPYKTAKRMWVDSFTDRYVAELLRQTSGNISRAAQLSGLTRAALQRILKRHNIDGSSFKGKQDEMRKATNSR